LAFGFATIFLKYKDYFFTFVQLLTRSITLKMKPGLPEWSEPTNSQPPGPIKEWVLECAGSFASLKHFEQKCCVMVK
jgi:hypothetical protein